MKYYYYAWNFINNLIDIICDWYEFTSLNDVHETYLDDLGPVVMSYKKYSLVGKLTIYPIIVLIAWSFLTIMGIIIWYGIFILGIIMYFFIALGFLYDHVFIKQQSLETT